MTIFIINKYTRWYNSIIHTALRRVKPSVYTEIHHIIPKSLGGSNKADNLVVLTAREHFICHMLLTKMVGGRSKFKMIFALNMMSVANDGQYRHQFTSYQYAYIRKHIQIVVRKTSSERRWVNKINIVKNIHVDELSAHIDDGWSRGRKQKKEKVSTPRKSTKGKTYEEMYGHDNAMRMKEDRSNALKGRTFSDETKKLWSTNRKGTNSGGSNVNAVPVTIDNITYACKADACKALGLTVWLLNKRLAAR